jgi:glycerophosphoryl diester phosphodiesterase
VILLGVTNAYILAPALQQEGEIVAYRGGGSEVNYKQLSETGCTASSLKESGINTVENTLEAVAISVDADADIIHLNVHRTADDELVVFHDWTLDCATDGAGELHKASFSQLKNIDAGYGYTFDDGTTFPFRGKGFRISKLEQFYQLYPDYDFWLNLKNQDAHSYDVLYSFLAQQNSKTIIVTSPQGMQWFKNKDSSIALMSVESVKKCAIDYLLMGWAGMVPDSCKNTILLIPPSKTKYFWGYPQRFAASLQKHGSKVYLWHKHGTLDIDQAEVIASGIGVVTGNTHFIGTAQAHKNLK